MDTREAEERRALASVACPWCRALRGEPCTVPDAADALRRRRRSGRPITTMPGAAHEARWLAAGLGLAPVPTRTLVGV